MIKLIITSDSVPTMTRRFDKPSVIIGGEHALHADIKLPDASLKDSHIQIVKQIDNGKTCYYVTNLTNDPFVTLNNLPFGKQPIYGNDLIQIGENSIRFEYEIDISSEENLKSNEHEEVTQNLSENFSNELKKNFNDLDLKNRKTNFPSNLDSYTETSVPAQFQEKQPSFPSTSNVETPNPVSLNNPKLSLKDYYLNDYEDDEETPSLREHNSNFLSPHFAKSWRAFLSIFAGFLSVIAIFISLFYLWVSDQTEEEEAKAARSVSDIAMSLTYAQLKHIHPQNQNWSYPEFIKNNLTSILAPNYISLAEIDAHGQFANCPYILRIYTSSDLSQFLVIAQPSPSLLQWIIPKASVIVDSRVMEMRKIKDLKPLNRLIVNSNNLDGVNANEISNLVKQGELIPLASLISKAENQGLAPPKALGLIRPGAENLIYNAPRYYLLSETILNSSLELMDNLAGMKEISLLQQELTSLLKFPDFVLYSSEGIQHALQAQKALVKLVPKENFLIADLQLNAHGKIASTHLLMDDNPSDIAISEKNKDIYSTEIFDSKVESKEVFEMDLALLKDLESQNEFTQASTQSDIDVENPLFLQLSALSNFRQSILKPIADELIDLIKSQTKSSQFDFIDQLKALQHKYNDLDREQQTKIFKKFNALTHEYTYLPAKKFLEYIEAADLKSLFKDYLLTLKERTEGQLSDDKFEQQFKLIQESKTWQELEFHVSQTSQLLQFDHIFEEGHLIAFQNTTRSIVTQKLNQFILSSNEALPSDAFAPDYLQTLTNILKAVWITDPDTHDFYIAEFELREPS